MWARIIRLEMRVEWFRGDARGGIKNEEILVKNDEIFVVKCE